jgi:hypothetical protein
MQFMFRMKASETAIPLTQKHSNYVLLHEAMPLPVAGGYSAGIQLLTAGEGWKTILPQLIDMTYSLM